MSTFRHLNLTELKEKREKYRTRLFYFMLEIALIFAVPAFAGLYIGKRLDQMWQTGTEATVPILLFTFVASWGVVIFRFTQISGKLKELNTLIKEKTE